MITKRRLLLACAAVEAALVCLDLYLVITKKEAL